MSKRVKAPDGQVCECVSPPYNMHPYSFDAEYEGDLGWRCCDRPAEDHEWPNHGGQLRRVYWDKTEHRCYAWWCANCCSWLSDDDWEDWEPWPTDEHGRFLAAVHCQTIPGLD
jgi:hypothetical protein